MKYLTLWLVPLTGIFFFLSICEAIPAADQPYNICILIPLTSHSHRAILFSLAKELLNRGHSVTVLSGLQPVLNHPNATEISHSLPVHIGNENVDMFKLSEEQGTITLDSFRESLVSVAKNIYKLPEVKDLYNRRHEFDLFIADANFNEPIYPFLHEAPFILVATPGKLPTYFAVQGNPLNPSYIPTLTDFPRPWSLLSRMCSAAETVFLAIAWRHYVVPYAQAEITPQFPSLPPLLDIERNVSLILINGHFTLDFVTPLLPSQIEVGGIHCRPAQKLPQDIDDWIKGSGDDGVVYFSLGSITRGNTIPSHLKEMFIRAFARLKQRVIWKFEEQLPNLPSNVLIKNWMPQQDIIAQPEVKVFISHGGLLGIQEAIYHSTPLIILPIFGDQHRNCEYIDQKQFGKCLSWKTLSEDIIFNSISEIINNQKYSKSISAVSKVWKDQPMTPLESAVWWTEYVIRNKGAPQLRSLAVDMPWIQFLMIDQLLVLVTSIVALYYSIKVFLSKYVCKSNKNKHKRD